MIVYIQYIHISIYIYVYSFIFLYMYTLRYTYKKMKRGEANSIFSRCPNLSQSQDTRPFRRTEFDATLT